MEQTKQDLILEAAIRRFSHFGIGKTTLTEIADDASLSRQSFLYYFQDKESLVVAVSEKLAGEFLQMLQSCFNDAGSLAEGLGSFLDRKRDFLGRYALLAMQTDRQELAGYRKLNAFMQKTKMQMTQMLAAFLTERVAVGELKDMDVRKTAKLILSTMAAFEHAVPYKSGVMSAKDLDKMFDLQREVLMLMVEGLKRHK